MSTNLKTHPADHLSEKQKEALRLLSRPEDYKLTHQQVAKAVGIDRRTLFTWRRIPEFQQAMRFAAQAAMPLVMQDIHRNLCGQAVQGDLQAIRLVLKLYGQLDKHTQGNLWPYPVKQYSAQPDLSEPDPAAKKEAFLQTTLQDGLWFYDEEDMENDEDEEDLENEENEEEKEDHEKENDSPYPPTTPTSQTPSPPYDPKDPQINHSQGDPKDPKLIIQKEIPKIPN